jgi:glutamate racemase
MNIGFFDSGLGGLLLLKETVKHLPRYDYIYYGDTFNLPYGDKTEDEIYQFTKAALEELFKRNCLLVIVACNTASAETLRRLQDSFIKDEYPDRRVLGVIVPTMESLLESGHKRALLLATKRTVESGKYEQELRKLDASISLSSTATPMLVPLIESHHVDEAVAAAANCIDTEAGEGDVVILGCTHYVLLKDALRAKFPTLSFISQDEVVPEKISEYLSRHLEITSRLTGTGKREIVLTEHRPDYDRLTAEFLGGAYIPEEGLS